MGRVQVNQENLKLNGTYQLLIYTDDFNILGRSLHTITKKKKKKKTGALVVIKKEIGLEVNANKMVMSRGQNAGQCHNMKTIIVPLKGWNSSNSSEQP
jgi:hypothetical protein